MATHVEPKVGPTPDIPAKCAQCPRLDKEHDPFSKATRFYCQSPLLYPERWFCALPAEVARA